MSLDSKRVRLHHHVPHHTGALLWALEISRGKAVNQISVDERTRKFARHRTRPHAFLR